MKSKPKHDKCMPRNVNNARHANPWYKNHVNKTKHNEHMLRNVSTTTYLKKEKRFWFGSVLFGSVKPNLIFMKTIIVA